MLIFDQLRSRDRELQVAAIAVLAGMIVLSAGLYYLQVVSADRYRSDERAQSVRTVRIPAIRGKILDRHGVPLAENRPSYNVNLYLEELRHSFRHEYTNRVRPEFKRAHPETALKGKVLGELERQARYRVVSNLLFAVSSSIREPRILLPDEFHKHYDHLRSLPLPLLRDLSSEQVASFVERTADVPSISLEAQPLRYYPFGRTAAHVLGHLRRDDEPEDDELVSYKFRLPDFAGAKGIELALDPELRGRAGVKLVQVNSLQYRQSDELWNPPDSGSNVVLTLDLSIQHAAEQALSKAALLEGGQDVRGAVVVMDVRSGDLYAVVSLPSFDPNRFITGFTHEEWASARMNDPELKPMFNRALYGTYAPGSSFKIVVALAALEAGVLDPEAIYLNRGFFQLRPGSRQIGDTAPPGPYNFRRAFYRSSNSYFIEYGVKIGPEKILQMARWFQLGERTGLWPRYEAAGDLPPAGELKKLDGSPWHAGDTWNLSIGQGEISVTPLQMAVLTAAVANGGTLLQPRLVSRIEPQQPSSEAKVVKFPSHQIRDRLKLSSGSLELVRLAMVEDVEHPEGTGKPARLPGFRIGGKTGTAQLMQGRSLKEYITWFVSFGPFEDPRYAVVVLVEGGVSGGTTCAPIAREVYRAIMERERTSPAPHQPLAASARDPGAALVASAQAIPAGEVQQE